MTWELIWMLVILKIPVVYLCFVVWWAIRAKPAPLEPDRVTASVGVDPRPGWSFARAASRSRRHGPHGRPGRGSRSTAAATRARR